LLQQLFASPAFRCVRGKEDHAHAVLGDARQSDSRLARDGLKELVGHLQQDPGAVAGIGFTTTGSAVIKIEQDPQRLLDNGVGLATLDVDHETDSAGVMLKLRIVKTLFAGRTGQDRPAATPRWDVSAHRFSGRRLCVGLAGSSINLEIFYRVGPGLQ